MRFLECEYRAAALAAAGALLASLALPPGTARAQQPYLMKISTPTIHDIPDTWADNFGAAVEKDSGGRIKVHVYPASQLGSIPRQIEGTQFGSIQMEVVPPEFMVGLDERFEVMAAPALVDSQAHGQRVAADPAVLKLMLEPRRRQGTARRRPVHGRTNPQSFRGHRCAVSPTSRARRSEFSPRSFRARRSNG